MNHSVMIDLVCGDLESWEPQSLIGGFTEEVNSYIYHEPSKVPDFSLLPQYSGILKTASAPSLNLSATTLVLKCPGQQALWLLSGTTQYRRVSIRRPRLLQALVLSPEGVGISHVKVAGIPQQQHQHFAAPLPYPAARLVITRHLFVCSSPPGVGLYVLGTFFDRDGNKLWEKEIYVFHQSNRRITIDTRDVDQGPSPPPFALEGRHQHRNSRLSCHRSSALVVCVVRVEFWHS